MKVLNFGSLNIDHVYSVDRIARPGETIRSGGYSVFAGGKGANQSAALARAGAEVYHAGRIGADGVWLREKLRGSGVNVELICQDPGVATGHAIIQVDAVGENSIVLFAGANLEVTADQVDATLALFGPGDILLLQNEINLVDHLIGAAAEREMKICLNPAPLTPEMLDLPLTSVDTLLVNQTEAAGLTSLPAASRPQNLVAALWQLTSGRDVVLTLGAEGVVHFAGENVLHEPAVAVDVVDTTGAGDTFIGFFVAALAGGRSVTAALREASTAAAICVCSVGAMDSIPTAIEVEQAMNREAR